MAGAASLCGSWWAAAGRAGVVGLAFGPPSQASQQKTGQEDYRGHRRYQLPNCRLVRYEPTATVEPVCSGDGGVQGPSQLRSLGYLISERELSRTSDAACAGV